MSPNLFRLVTGNFSAVAIPVADAWYLVAAKSKYAPLPGDAGPQKSSNVRSHCQTISSNRSNRSRRFDGSWPLSLLQSAAHTAVFRNERSTSLKDCRDVAFAKSSAAVAVDFASEVRITPPSFATL